MLEQEHLYGDHVHLVHDPMAASGLIRLCDKEAGQDTVIGIVKTLYRDVLLRAVVNLLFPIVKVTVQTPMVQHIGRKGVLEDYITDPATRVVIATLLRAGAIPSSACLNRLVSLLDNGNLRQDFFGASRQTDENHHVTGTLITYDKSGPIDDQILLIPDPMGATGGSVIQTLKQYGDIGKARSIATVHLIVTPEYIRRISAEHPEVHIFALRVDRGMSDTEVQDSIPGTFPEREFGLTDTQYIAPGAGDMGYRLTGVP